MDDATIESLAALDRRFYEDNAASFISRRQHPWRGWRRLVERFTPGLRVLDVGCGHGRFADFLSAQPGAAEFHYLGLDHSPALLKVARSRHPERRFEAVELLHHDLAGYGPFDLVVAFGLLHHIPGAPQRRRLVHNLAARVAPGGALVFTLWSVDPMGDKRRPPPQGLTLGPRDLILGWGPNPEARRYCHDVDEPETQELVQATGLRLQDDFRDDGRGGRNRYLVFVHDG